MDEDEKEMLSEARARLANTKCVAVRMRSNSYGMDLYAAIKILHCGLRACGGAECLPGGCSSCVICSTVFAAYRPAHHGAQVMYLAR